MCLIYIYTITLPLVITTLIYVIYSGHIILLRQNKSYTYITSHVLPFDIEYYLEIYNGNEFYTFLFILGVIFIVNYFVLYKYLHLEVYLKNKTNTK